MVLLEAEVHSSLRSFLKEQNQLNWPHHLTMARIVARALRLKRSSLIQTGSTLARYCLSYLTPALLGDSPVILVAPPDEQQRLLRVEIPQLQQGLGTHKEILVGYSWPNLGNFQGLMLISPQDWLKDRIHNLGRFPNDIPTLIDQADRLESWTTQYLTLTLTPSDWIELIEQYPQCANLIRDTQAKLTKLLLGHPKNPYQCYLLDEEERSQLKFLFSTLSTPLKGRKPCGGAVFAVPRRTLYAPSPTFPFFQFWQQWQQENQLIWASIFRESGQFILQISPAEVATTLSSIWQRQPVVLMGGFLDQDKNASIYRQKLGLGDLLTLKFSANLTHESIQLYLPKRLPLPNTPEFRGVLMEQIDALINAYQVFNSPIIVLVDDVPLKAQVGTLLAATFGSKVQVEKIDISKNAIIVCGWQFWHLHQEQFSTPQLLIVATLPIPSPENPLVAGRIAYYKRQHQDWFRFYLLPTAVREIQRAIMPLRESQGIVAILDNRVNSRSYGLQILEALEPYDRINYLDRIMINL